MLLTACSLNATLSNLDLASSPFQTSGFYSSNKYLDKNTTYTITWDSTKYPGNSKIQFYISTDGGQNYTALTETNNTGSTNIQFNSVTDTSTARLKVLIQNDTVYESESFIIDSTPPVATPVTTPAAKLKGNSSQRLTFNLSDNIAGLNNAKVYWVANSTETLLGTTSFEQSASEVTQSPNTHIDFTLPTANISGQLKVVFFDNSGNSTQQLFNTEIDSTAPSNPTITLTPASYTNSASINVGISNCTGIDKIIIDQSSSTPTLTDVNWATCNTSNSYSITGTDGTKSIYLHIKDDVGNTNQSSVSIILDSTLPTITWNPPSGGQELKGGGTYNLTWTATDANFAATPVDLLYSVNGGTSFTTLQTSQTASGTYNWTLPALDNSTVQLQIKATDLAGNTQTLTSSNFTIDSTAPSASLTINGLTPTITNIPGVKTITLSGASDITHVKGFLKKGSSCSGEIMYLQGLTERTYASVDSVNLNQGDGDYIYCVIGRDAAGNYQSTISSSAVLTLDTVAPALILSSPTANTRAQQKVTLAGTCETGLNISYAGAGLLSPFSGACSGGNYSTDAFFSASDGNKDITLTQTDAAGNSTTISRTFVRDNVGPILTQTTSSNPTYSTLNTVTWGGACEGTANVQITGTDTTSVACSSNTWTYTAATQTSDASYTYSVSQSDEAGNSTGFNLIWTRDTVAPALTFTSSSTIISAGNTATFSGQCEDGLNIAVTGDATTSVTCASGSWSYTTPTKSSDGTYNYQFKQTDLANNTTTINGTWTRDTTGPALTLSGSSSQLSNQNSVTFSGNCESSIANVEIAQPTVTTTPCSSGSWTYTYNNTTDATYNFEFYQQNGLGTRTTVNATWKRDTIAPTLTASEFTINSGASTTNKRVVKINLKAQDAASRVSQLCLKFDDSTSPAANAGCWVSPFTAATNIVLTNYNYSLGLSDKAYTIYAWVKDEVGNISALTNSGGGTTGTDKQIITVSVGEPSTVDLIAAATNSPSTPPTLAETQVAAGSPVYILWNWTDDRSLSSATLDLEFSTDGNNYSSITTGLSNGINGSCTLSGSATGCYKWTAPTSAFMRIRAKATDNDGNISVGDANALNTVNMRIIAGKTDTGLGQSPKVNVFAPTHESTYYSDDHRFVVARDGSIYVRDHLKGIVKIDPSTGTTSLFIRRTGASTGDGGLAPSATLEAPHAIILDKAQPHQNLIIYDNNRIRSVNLGTNIITTIIGGGNDPSSGAIATNFQISPPVYGSGHWANTSAMIAFFALPNGDILFQHSFHRAFPDKTDEGANSTGSRLWWFKKAENKVYSILPTGSGAYLKRHTNDYNASIDISKCPHLSYFPDLLSDGTLVRFGNVTHVTSYENRFSSGAANCHVTGFDSWRWQDTPHFLDLNGQKINEYWDINLPVWPYDGQMMLHYTAMYLGHNNKIYASQFAADAQKGIFEFNRDTREFVRIAGSGADDYCADGTAALSCAIRATTVFVTENSQVYFMSKNTIRMIDESGNIRTIAGLTTMNQEGLALQSLVGNFLDFHIRDNGWIVASDQNDNQFREINPGIAIKTVASADLQWAHNSGGRFAIHPTTGDIFHHRSIWGISQFARSSSSFGASGNWSTWSQGSGSALGWDDPAANGTSNIDFIANGASNTGPDVALGFNGWGGWIPPYPLLFDGDNLVVGMTKFALEMNNGAYVRAHMPHRNSLLTFNYNTKIMNRIAGKLSTVNYTIDVNGGAVATDTSFTAFEWGYRLSGPFVDPGSNPKRYIFGDFDSPQKIYELITGGGINVIGNLDNQYSALAHRKSGAQDIIYYCHRSAGTLHKRNLTTNTETTITMGIPGLICKGYKMNWNYNNNTLIFFGALNGFNVMAEFYDP